VADAAGSDRGTDCCMFVGFTIGFDLALRLRLALKLDLKSAFKLVLRFVLTCWYIKAIPKNLSQRKHFLEKRPFFHILDNAFPKI